MKTGHPLPCDGSVFCTEKHGTRPTLFPLFPNHLPSGEEGRGHGPSSLPFQGEGRGSANPSLDPSSSPCFSRLFPLFPRREEGHSAGRGWEEGSPTLFPEATC